MAGGGAKFVQEPEWVLCPCLMVKGNGGGDGLVGTTTVQCSPKLYVPNVGHSLSFP